MLYGALIRSPRQRNLAWRARAIAMALVLRASPPLPSIAQSQNQQPAAARRKRRRLPKERRTSRPTARPIRWSPASTARRSSARTSRRCASTLPPQVQQQPPEQLYPQLLDQLVALQLVLAGRAQGRSSTTIPRVKKLDRARRRADPSGRLFRRHRSRKEITEAKLSERYDKTLKAAPPQEEVHARHILVATEAEAKEIIAQLKKGADFAKLAKEKTTDPPARPRAAISAISPSRTWCPEFANAAFALEDGRVHADAGQDAVRLARHQGRGPPPGARRRPTRRWRRRSRAQMAQEIYQRKGQGARRPGQGRSVQRRRQQARAQAARRCRRAARRRGRTSRRRRRRHAAGPAAAHADAERQSRRAARHAAPPTHGAGDPGPRRSSADHGRRGLAARARALPRPAAARRRAARRPRIAASAISDRTRSDGGGARAGQRRRRRLHPLAHAGRAGRLVPHCLRARHGARDRRQFRQRQRLHRPGRPRRGRGDRRRRGAATSAARRARSTSSSTGVIGEALPAREDRRGAARGARRRRRRALARGGRGDHDHRHLPQGRDAQRHDRRHARHHQRHRQGLGHDRARHGDDAGLCLHRRGDPGAGAAGAAQARGNERSFNSITVDGDTSTSDTVLLFATGQARQRAARRRRRSAPARISAARSTR